MTASSPGNSRLSGSELDALDLVISLFHEGRLDASEVTIPADAEDSLWQVIVTRIACVTLMVIEGGCAQVPEMATAVPAGDGLSFDELVAMRNRLAPTPRSWGSRSGA